MESCELSISAGELIGVPRVTLRGCMDGWHAQAVSGILMGYRDNATTSLVLDLAGLTFAGVDGATAMINVLRTLGPEICVHVVVSGSSKSILGRAKLGPCIRLYSSTDELAEYISPDDEYFTSRWVASRPDETELPRAA